MDTDFEYKEYSRILKLNELRIKFTHDVELRIEIYKYLLRNSEREDTNDEIDDSKYVWKFKSLSCNC
jgi:hypothetical protein